MFTGIIEGVCPVRAVSPGSGGRRLAIDLGQLADGMKPGDSVSVSGVCLTVARLEGTAVSFDVVPETLERSSLARLGPGSRVNVERALRLGDRLGGHLVQGHVDGQGSVIELTRRGAAWTLAVRVSAALRRGLIPKGSIAVDGISLTVASLDPDRFSVAVVPFTLEHTTLFDRRSGDPVNLEIDLIGKWVRQTLLEMFPTGITEAKLREEGFLEGGAERAH
ncbi:MAG: riboflavin synthase [Planctomycetota bacterium]